MSSNNKLYCNKYKTYFLSLFTSSIFIDYLLLFIYNANKINPQGHFTVFKHNYNFKVPSPSSIFSSIVLTLTIFFLPTNKTAAKDFSHLCKHEQLPRRQLDYFCWLKIFHVSQFLLLFFLFTHHNILHFYRFIFILFIISTS